MKKIIIPIILLVLSLASCQKFLHEEKTTGYTVGYIYSTPDGLNLALTAVYALHKTELYSDTDYHAAKMVPYRRSDLVSNGTINTGSFWQDWNPVYVIPSNAQIRALWNAHYKMVSRANEIIEYGEAMEQSEFLESVIAQAKCLRAFSYLYLYQNFGRLWLNTKAITPENVDDHIVYRPATKDEVMALLCDDLDYAIDHLPWKTEPGRYNQAAARHLRMEVAMYMQDWDTALEQVEKIDASGEYGLVDVREVFSGKDLNHREVLLSEQWSTNLGGNCDPSKLTGHYYATLFISKYWDGISGSSFAERTSDENGGFTQGRILPNPYLLGLYDQTKDKRLDEWFILKYRNTSSQTINYDGVQVAPGEFFPEKKGGKYVSSIMPGSRKYWDTETRANGEIRGFKDMIVFRLAETYIWAAEAALKNNDMTKALLYYNKTWERAGNDKFTGTLTMRDIIDEHARELNLEGGRFFYLKRLGKAIEYISDHGGNPALGDTYAVCRANIINNPHFLDLPIPQAQINTMGPENFPQNPGY